eukprot:5699065-Pleurochrysis_carterae.AAC.1
MIAALTKGGWGGARTEAEAPSTRPTPSNERCHSPTPHPFPHPRAVPAQLRSEPRTAPIRITHSCMKCECEKAREECNTNAHAHTT